MRFLTLLLARSPRTSTRPGATRFLPLLLVAVVIGLTGCTAADAGSGAESAELADNQQSEAEAAWLADVEEALGAEVPDVDALRAQAVESCTRTSVEDWTVELAAAGSASTVAVTRVGLEHLCSDVLPAFDEARAAVDSAADTNALICQLPLEKLAADAQLKVKMVCSR